MSTIKINVKDLNNGFKEIDVDGVKMGKIEDPEDELVGLLRRIVKHLDINTEVVRDTDED